MALLIVFFFKDRKFFVERETTFYIVKRNKRKTEGKNDIEIQAIECCYEKYNGGKYSDNTSAIVFFEKKNAKNEQWTCSNVFLFFFKSKQSLAKAKRIGRYQPIVTTINRQHSVDSSPPSSPPSSPATSSASGDYLDLEIDMYAFNEEVGLPNSPNSEMLAKQSGKRYVSIVLIDVLLDCFP